MTIMSQLAVIFGVCLVSEGISALLPFQFPASVISMVLLAALLLCGVVKERHIQLIAKFLITNMGLFFVPAMVGTLEYMDVLKSQLIPFLVVSFLSTPVVYVATAWTVQLLMSRKKKGGERDA